MTNKIDWSKAPKGANFYAKGVFRKKNTESAGVCNYYYNGWEWCRSAYLTEECKKEKDYQERSLGCAKIMPTDRKELPDTDKVNSHNLVKSPSHYHLMDGVESIEIIARSMTLEQWKGFCLGNILKYRIRAGKKDSLQQDIDKANFYGELYEKHKDKCYN